MQMRELYRQVTDSIVAELEQGAAPWLKPWRTGNPRTGLLPVNAASGREYRGINIPILWGAAVRQGFVSPLWLTYKQANALGGQVRRGAHGTPIVFTSRVSRDAPDGESDGDAERRSRSFLRSYTVFNVGQIDGLPEDLTRLPSPPDADTVNTAAWRFVHGTSAMIRHGGDEACYYPGPDFIAMPPLAAFLSTEAYYATTLHELGHWTGHPTRLARDLFRRFGEQQYAAEELIAELCSAFLCAHLGITGELRHAGYIDDWVRMMRGDVRAVFTAASKASEAAEYLRAVPRYGGDAGPSRAPAGSPTG